MPFVSLITRVAHALPPSLHVSGSQETPSETGSQGGSEGAREGGKGWKGGKGGTCLERRRRQLTERSQG